MAVRSSFLSHYGSAEFLQIQLRVRRDTYVTTALAVLAAVSALRQKRLPHFILWVIELHGKDRILAWPARLRPQVHPSLLWRTTAFFRVALYA